MGEPFCGQSSVMRCYTSATLPIAGHVRQIPERNTRLLKRRSSPFASQRPRLPLAVPSLACPQISLKAKILRVALAVLRSRFRLKSVRPIRWPIRR